MFAMTAAHKTLPLPCYARVTNLANGRSVVVRINDRGPFVANRIIDLSYTAARKLDMMRNGTAFVQVEALTPAGPATGADLPVTTPGGLGRQRRCRAACRRSPSRAAAAQPRRARLAAAAPARRRGRRSSRERASTSRSVPSRRPTTRAALRKSCAPPASRTSSRWRPHARQPLQRVRIGPIAQRAGIRRS